LSRGAESRQHKPPVDSEDNGDSFEADTILSATAHLRNRGLHYLLSHPTFSFIMWGFRTGGR